MSIMSREPVDKDELRDSCRVVEGETDDESCAHGVAHQAGLWNLERVHETHEKSQQLIWSVLDIRFVG